MPTSHLLHLSLPEGPAGRGHLPGVDATRALPSSSSPSTSCDEVGASTLGPLVSHRDHLDRCPSSSCSIHPPIETSTILRIFARIRSEPPGAIGNERLGLSHLSPSAWIEISRRDLDDIPPSIATLRKISMGERERRGRHDVLRPQNHVLRSTCCACCAQVRRTWRA